jgi:hypothetical protein
VVLLTNRGVRCLGRKWEGKPLHGLLTNAGVPDVSKGNVNRVLHEEAEISEEN